MSNSKTDSPGDALIRLSTGAKDPAKTPDDGLSRRDFFTLVGASLALSAGCRPPREVIYEYSRQPVEMTPGVPLHFATSMCLGGRAGGLVVASYEGRPIKVEGNPEHPANLGAANAWQQASVRQLYDPDRAKLFKKHGVPVGRQTFFAAVAEAAARHRGDRGRGLALLLEPTSSPSLGDLIARLRAAFPELRTYSYSALSEHQRFEGARLAFGRPVETVYDFTNADVILSLDADFLALMPLSLRYARQFAERRVPENGMNRLFVVENSLSSTGQMADHRLRARSSDIADVAVAFAKQLAAVRGAAQGTLGPIASHLDGMASGWDDEPFIRACARDLAAHPGRAVVVVGERQPPIVHAIAHAMNAAIAAPQKCVSYYEPLIDVATGPESLARLTAEMNAGQVQSLFITCWNPTYTAPSDIGFSEALKRVPGTFYLGPYEDETFKEVGWLAPAAHYLEAWSDERAADGTVSFCQPLIAPIFGGITPGEMLASLLPPPPSQAINAPLGRQEPQYINRQTPTPPVTPEEGPSPEMQQPFSTGAGGGGPSPGAYALLRSYWAGVQSKNAPGADFDLYWERTLQRGFESGSAAPAVGATLAMASLAPALASAHAARAAGGLELNFYPDARIYDGRFANNPWLQEFPEPMTKLTWDNAALLSQRTAADLGVETGSLVELEVGGSRMRAPILVLPGHADDSISLALGSGRVGEELVAAGVGFNAGQVRAKDSFWFGGGLHIKKLGGKYPLALEQEVSSMESRPIAISATLGELQKTPTMMEAHKEPLPSLWPQVEYKGNKWGMGIDLSRCVGCGACVVACVAENNVPPVGKEQVLKGRIMLWLRLDRYFLESKNIRKGRGKSSVSDENPGVIVQPLFCVHCENAPCEYVCPVNATVHSEEGLNLMVYNRCVGTRYCSNNCPYKVRRFNYLTYNKGREETSLVQMLKNPDVTVRERGVMEKCTYCVQRIERARIDRRRHLEDLREGDIVTACQQTCPSQAIVFGDLNDPSSRAARMHEDPRSYYLLHQLGTRPRSAHLIRITNPHPELE